MAQVPENSHVQDEAPPPDGIKVMLSNVGLLRAKLLSLRGSKPKEYDRVLKQSYPLDVLTLLEMLAIECGNRTAGLAYRFEELATVVFASEDEAEDSADMAEDFDAVIDAARVLVKYLHARENLPDDVRAAVTALEDGGILEEPEDEDEPADEDEGEGEAVDAGEPKVEVADEPKDEHAGANGLAGEIKVDEEEQHGEAGATPWVAPREE